MLRSRGLLAVTLLALFAVFCLLSAAGPAQAAPGKPTAKTPKGSVSGARPTFTWSKVSSATSYEVQVFQGTELLVKKKGLITLSWQSTKPLPRTVALTWKVRARNASGNGAWSASRKFTILSNAKKITAFSIKTPAATGVVDEASLSIRVSVPFGTDVTSLVADFTTTGTSVAVGSKKQVSGTTANSFTGPVTYTVTAADGTEKEYEVRVSVSANSAKAITSFNFPVQDDLGVPAVGTINETEHTVALTVPFGTNVKKLVAAFSTTGSSVKVGSVVQISSVSANDFTNPVTYTVTAADATTQTYRVTVTVAKNSEAKFTTFGFAAQTGLASAADGVIDEAKKTITVTVPSGTDLAANDLIATFAVSQGALVRVGQTSQESSVTANDFSSDVTYSVISENLNVAQSYTVTVKVAPSSAKQITAFSFRALSPIVNGTINQSNRTIALTVPFGTNVTNLVATFTITGASVNVVGTNQVSGTTANNFTNPVTYTVVAADGTSQSYTVTVTVAASSAKAFTAFSFRDFAPVIDAVINEGAHTITAMVPFGTDVTALRPTFTVSPGATVRIGSTAQTSGVTTANFTGDVTYTVVAADGSTQDYVARVTVDIDRNAKAITAYSFQALSPAVNGLINEAAHTIDVNVPYGTNVTNLVATFTLSAGATATIGAPPLTQVSGTTPWDFTSPVTYTVTASNGTTQTYVVTVTVGKNPAKQLLTFGFDKQDGLTDAVIGSVNQVSHVIDVKVPVGTTRTSLAASFTTSPGATVSIGAVLQTSGQTENDFTNPVTYTVEAAAGGTQDYRVTVTEDRSAKQITEFGFKDVDDVTAQINQTNHTIAVTVPYGTDITKPLVATFTKSAGATVKIGSVAQTSGETPNSFLNPVTYTVVAADETTQPYVVTVTVAANTEAQLKTFNFLALDPDVIGVVNQTTHEIALTVPYKTSVTGLVATFTKSDGATVKVGSTAQVSGTTANNFGSPVTYTVTAADGVTKQNYTVTVTVTKNAEAKITEFKFAALSPIVNGDINEGAGTIALAVPPATDVTKLVATFTASGDATVEVAGTTQVSGTTVLNFTAPVTYTVTSQDGATTKSYVVTVTKAVPTR